MGHNLHVQFFNLFWQEAVGNRPVINLLYTRQEKRCRSSRKADTAAGAITSPDHTQVAIGYYPGSLVNRKCL
ncbi:hypothetical protein L2E82_16553 [Cichorium intybus]|uniref:Uncharacterized protein n=1 Tax=Cichorium intybus TaxID=13427 RepID=A0ACB9F6F8_CICIN|nr:hypothetical protein L2E82_16553 [Cichorium intybus]